MARSLPVFALLLMATSISATTYYVSSSAGDDGNTGLAPDQAFATVAHVNGLELMPGDEMRFACGDIWRTDRLHITRSGSAGQPIVFGSYPAACADKPLLSGAQPISGWAPHAELIYVADLAAGDNAGRFAFGVNQLFGPSGRLPFGRWPDLDLHPDHGWSEIDAAASGQITDTDLPAGDWTGAVAHVRGMTWYIVNRTVTADTGSTLTLSSDPGCFNGSCAGWGYYLSNHLETLSKEGEWYYDAATHRVYLFSAFGPPADGQIEGSVVLTDDGVFHGGITLGRHLWEHLEWVTVENLRIERWFDAGVSTPTNHETDDSSNVVLRGLEIRDVDAVGLRLQTWVWNAGPESGWRGGHDLTVEHLLIQRANHHGIDSYAHSSVFSDVVISQVGLLHTAGASGIGCGFDTSGGFCTEAGAGVRLKRDLAEHSSHHLTLSGFQVFQTGANSLDIFGDTITVTGSLIGDACLTKSDCGAIRTFGNGNPDNPQVFDILIEDTIILDALADNGGCHADYRFPLAFGLYIDHGSANVVADNVSIGRTRPVAILYQNSRGAVTNSRVHDTQPGTWGGTAVRVVGNSELSLEQTDLVEHGDTIDLIRLDNLDQLVSSDFNHLFQPRTGAGLCIGGVCTGLAGWQAATGGDANSTTAWYSLDPEEDPRSAMWGNLTPDPAVFDFGGAPWVDLNLAPVPTIALPGWHAVILVEEPTLIFADFFETGTHNWTQVVP